MELSIVLVEDAKALDEVVVVGYGTQKKSSLTGSVVKTKGGGKVIDYTPTDVELVKNKGIHIPKIEGDEKGLYLGFPLREDILGNTIIGVPDIGAIELD